MFDNNKNIIAGRDIVVNLKDSYNKTTIEQLKQRERECSYSLKKESLRKLKRLLIFAFIVYIFIFIFIFFGIDLIASYSESDFLKSIADTIDIKMKLVISILLEMICTLDSVKVYTTDNTFEKKCRDELNEIRNILKERQYLNNQKR